MLQMIDSNMPVADVSITTEPAELRRMMGISLKREARLDAAGITCDLKECQEYTCLACPFNGCHDDENPKQTLCRIGMEQDILSTLLLAQSRGEPVGEPRISGA